MSYRSFNHKFQFLTTPIYFVYSTIYWIDLLIKAFIMGTFICNTTNILSFEFRIVQW